jgi:hypothetical protein
LAKKQQLLPHGWKTTTDPPSSKMQLYESSSVKNAYKTEWSNSWNKLYQKSTCIQDRMVKNAYKTECSILTYTTLATWIVRLKLAN